MERSEIAPRNRRPNAPLLPETCPRGERILLISRRTADRGEHACGGAGPVGPLWGAGPAPPAGLVICAKTGRVTSLLLVGQGDCQRC